MTVVDELRVRQMLDRLGEEIDALRRLSRRPLDYADVFLRDRVDDLVAFRIALARAASD